MFTITQRSAKLKSGKSPIVLIVYGERRGTSNKRGQKIITLKTPACFPDEWNQEFKRYRKTVDGFKIYNASLKLIEDRCDKIYQNLVGKAQVPTIDDFIEQYKNVSKKKTNPPTVTDQWRKYAAKIKGEGRIKTNTVLLNSMRLWIRFYKDEIGNDIAIKDVNLETLNSFTSYMERIKNAPNTIGMRMRDLRTIYNYSRHTKVIPKDVDYPFEHYSWRKTKGRVLPHEHLTKEEWESFKTLTLEDKKLERFRDIFIFMVHCHGINFRDLVCLTYKENVKGNEIHFQRKKTRGKVTDKIKVFISPKMEKLMTRYRNAGVDQIFPVMSRYPEDPSKWQNTYEYTLKKFNAALKAIANEAEIEQGKRISSYVARHTYATLMYFEGISVSIISQSLGHTTEKETTNYLKSIDAERVYEITKGIL